MDGCGGWQMVGNVARRSKSPRFLTAILSRSLYTSFGVAWRGGTLREQSPKTLFNRAWPRRHSDEHRLSANRSVGDLTDSSNVSAPHVSVLSTFQSSAS